QRSDGGTRVTSSEVGGADESSGLQHEATSLQELIAESHHAASVRIADFTRLATAVQIQRREMGVSDTRLITRSTALWTLTQLDDSIRKVLEKSGADLEALRALLSITSAPTPFDVDVAELHEDFAHAVSTYLSELPGGRPFDLPDLAAAILQSGRDDSRGLLP